MTDPQITNAAPLVTKPERYDMEGCEHHKTHRPPYILSGNTFCGTIVKSTLDCYCMKYFAPRGTDLEGRSYFNNCAFTTNSEFHLERLTAILSDAKEKNLPYELCFVQTRFRNSREEEW